MSSNPDHILKSLHWLEVQKRIEYEVISTMYKLLQSRSSRYLHELITVQPYRSNRSSTLVTVQLQPSVDSSLEITNRSFGHTASYLWNKIPATLSVHYQSDTLSSSCSSKSKTQGLTKFQQKNARQLQVTELGLESGRR